MSVPHDRPSGRNRFAIAAGTLMGLVLCALGYLGFLGWFGGPVYRVEPAAAVRPLARRGTVAVFLSGDTGFNAGMAPRVMGDLAARGLPVLGVNSLTAFGTRRTPAQTRALVADTVARALRLPGARRVVLIGQSFGADMLQYGVSGLPLPLRPYVAQVLLSVPGDTLLFKASPGGLLDGAPDAPALPSARRIDWVPLLCIHGVQEDNSLCPLLHGRNVRVVTLPGDHYLHHDADRLSAVLWQAIVRGR
ncbi:MAG: type IV secretion system protein VirJ [Sphingomonas taxi]|uniref:Type IV secretion system protein VirJ n=1 Tax=Sphingomonas taxi TaxID=1549858 RepID=A0A2W5P9M5_9SPHN|nr:MAG: type IV secretion system protein VirJ [Sphingomonas taxi]